MRALAEFLRRVFARRSIPDVARTEPAPPRRLAADAFTPTRPRAGRRRLVGRERELATIVGAIVEEGAHVVLYSERGRGKTSLANLAAEHLRRAGLVVARTSCDAGTTYDTMVRSLLREVPRSLLTAECAGEGCEGLLPARPLVPSDLASVPASLACPRLVLLVDEFDRVADASTRTMVADTIKLLSDRAIPIHFMIVGVSSTLQQILGQHPSIERNITALHLPLLSDAEVANLLARGGEAIGITFSTDAVAAIAAVARGMPYMAQLMGLRVTQSVLARDADVTTAADVARAVEQLLADAPGDIAGLYASLATAPDGADMQRALLDLAQAPHDGYGRITQPHNVTASMVERLIEAGALRRPAGAPGLLEPVDRRLNYHVLLLALKEGGAQRLAPVPDLRRAAI